MSEHLSAWPGRPPGAEPAWGSACGSGSRKGGLAVARAHSLRPEVTRRSLTHSQTGSLGGRTPRPHPPHPPPPFHSKCL